MKNRPLFFALALTLVTSLFGTIAAQAQTPTVITSLPYKITTSGTYVLNSDLNSSLTSAYLIEVKASNVTIDLQNHYIAGPVNNTSQSSYGIYAYEQSNITVENGTIAYCNVGVLVQGSGQTTTNSVGHQIDNIHATYCYQTGIFVVNSPASRITNCQVSQGGFSGAGIAYGIYAAGAGTTVSGCVVSTVTATNSVGIFANTGSFIRRNTVSNCASGIYGGKYQDNLTSGCAIPYSNGTDAGGNN